MSAAPVAQGSAPVPHARPATPTPLGAERFVEGRPYQHPEGTETHFEDDQWTLRHQPLVTVSFRELPGWLKEPVKRFQAMRWLEEGMSTVALMSTMTTARWWARALGESVGRDLRDLTEDHAFLVREKLTEARTLARAAVEAAALAKGAPLGPRERRQVAGRSGGLLNSERLATEIDLICAHARSSYGWDIRFVVGRIKLAAEDARGPMSADESKVLTREQREALVACCDREIRRYRHALELLEWALSAGAQRQPTRQPGGRHSTYSKPERDRQAQLLLEFYFGLNCRALHSSPAICAALEMSASFAPGLGRNVKKRLAKSSMDEATVSRVLALRDQIARRKKDILGVDPVREEMVDLLVAHGIASDEERSSSGMPVVRAVATAQPVSLAGAVAAAAASAGYEVDRNAIRAYFGLLDGITRSTVQTSAIYGYGSALYGRKRVLALVEGMIGRCRTRRLMKIRNALHTLHANAIKACALKLQLAASRRISALVSLDADPKVDLHWLGGQKTAVIHFRAWKGWGDQGVPDPTPCPDNLADLALVAIEEAQGLTAALRHRASPEDARLLFLLAVRTRDADERLGAKPLSYAVLSTWLYNDEEGRGACLLERYKSRLRDVGGLKNFSTHHARHTNATHLVEGGASLHSVARFLGHNFRGDPAMASTSYVAGGTKSMRARRVEEIEKLQGTGYIHDAVVRVQLEAAGPEAQRDHPGSMELSLTEAVRRIREADLLVPVRYDASDAVALVKAGKIVYDNGLGGCVVPLDEEIGLLADGLTIHVTRQGGCYLPAEDGACPAGGEDCSVGVEPEDPAVREGRGCKWRWLAPVGLEHLQQELAVIEAQIVSLEGVPKSAQMRAKQIARRDMKQKEIAMLTQAAEVAP